MEEIHSEKKWVGEESSRKDEVFLFYVKALLEKRVPCLASIQEKESRVQVFKVKMSFVVSLKN